MKNQKKKVRKDKQTKNSNPTFDEVYNTMKPTIVQLVSEAVDGGLGAYESDRLRHRLETALKRGYGQLKVATYGGFEKYLGRRLTWTRNKFMEQIAQHPERHFTMSIVVAVETDEGDAETEKDTIPESMLADRDEAGVAKEPEVYRRDRAREIRRLLGTFTKQQQKMLWAILEEGSVSAASRAYGEDPKNNRFARLAKRFAAVVRKAGLEPEGRRATRGFEPRARTYLKIADPRKHQ